jgi:hypothetical protein
MMRGLLDGRGWVEIEGELVSSLYLRRPCYAIKGDPEAGYFDAESFEEIEQ